MQLRCNYGKGGAQYSNRSVMHYDYESNYLAYYILVGNSCKAGQNLAHKNPT